MPSQSPNETSQPSLGAVGFPKAAIASARSRSIRVFPAFVKASLQGVEKDKQNKMTDSPSPLRKISKLDEEQTCKRKSKIDFDQFTAASVLSIGSTRPRTEIRRRTSTHKTPFRPS